MHLRKVTGNRKAECGSAGKLYLNYKAGRGRLTQKARFLILFIKMGTLAILKFKCIL